MCGRPENSLAHGCSLSTWSPGVSRGSQGIPAYPGVPRRGPQEDLGFPGAAESLGVPERSLEARGGAQDELIGATAPIAALGDCIARNLYFLVKALSVFSGTPASPCAGQRSATEHAGFEAKLAR